MITLKYEDKTAVVAAECGMNTCSLYFGSEKILREAPGIEVLRSLPNVFGTPLLLPPGRVPDGKFSFEDKDYQLVLNDIDGHGHIHGILSLASFTVTEQTASSVTGTYENRGQIFPFPYRITVSCRLEQDGYIQEFEIENTGSANMPLAFGLHTCFDLKDSIKLPISHKMSRGKLLPLDPFGKRLAGGGLLSEGEFIDDSYKLSGNEIRIGKHSYVLSDTFKFMTVWNYDTKSGFIALEPQSATAGALSMNSASSAEEASSEGRGLRILAPGESAFFKTQIL